MIPSSRLSEPGGQRNIHCKMRFTGREVKFVNEALGQLEPFPVQFIFEDDADWQAYSRFL
jgi:hypothetical protein